MKKIIPPLIITIICIIYFALYFGVLIWVIPNIWLKVLLALFPLAFSGVMIYVFVLRIIEIRSGEEDDISKY